MSFGENLRSLAAKTEEECGNLKCKVKLADSPETIFDWHDLLSLFCAIGSQTLTIRGSEKSAYGKLFERLVLGSVLTILGFEPTALPPKKTSSVFWLSSAYGEREADATVLIKPGRAVRFDLGFIGRGNPEITKDKVSRYEREFEIGRSCHYSKTCIIVDRVAQGSGLARQAERIGARVIQMSMSYWPLELARWLKDELKYDSGILEMRESELAEFFKQQLSEIPLENFVKEPDPRPAG